LLSALLIVYWYRATGLEERGERPVPTNNSSEIDPTDDGLTLAKLPPVEETIETILHHTDYDRRIHASVYDLPHTLTPTHSLALDQALLTPQDGQDADFRQHEYALRNYIMDALRTQIDRLPETISTFIAVYQNKRQGDVMRGYALQHLCSVYIDHDKTLSVEEKQRILNTFTDALNDTSKGTLAATALVGLHEAARSDSETVLGKAVERAALKLLQSPDSGALSKLSAFQICGERKVADATPMARKIALDTSADWGSRIGAIYALGQLRKLDGLESLLNDTNQNVSRAARMAFNAKR